VGKIMNLTGNYKLADHLSARDSRDDSVSERVFDSVEEALLYFDERERTLYIPLRMNQREGRIRDPKKPVIIPAKPVSKEQEEIDRQLDGGVTINGHIIH
jgi:hypothetical protein